MSHWVLGARSGWEEGTTHKVTIDTQNGLCWWGPDVLQARYVFISDLQFSLSLASPGTNSPLSMSEWEFSLSTKWALFGSCPVHSTAWVLRTWPSLCRHRPGAQWQCHHSASTTPLQEAVSATECHYRLQPTPRARALRLTLSGTCLGVVECGVLTGAPQPCVASVHCLIHTLWGDLLSLGLGVSFGVAVCLRHLHCPVRAAFPLSGCCFLVCVASSVCWRPCVATAGPAGGY